MTRNNTPPSLCMRRVLKWRQRVTVLLVLATGKPGPGIRKGRQVMQRIRSAVEHLPDSFLSFNLFSLPSFLFFLSIPFPLPIFMLSFSPYLTSSLLCFSLLYIVPPLYSGRRDTPTASDHMTEKKKITESAKDMLGSSSCMLGRKSWRSRLWDLHVIAPRWLGK